MVQCIIFDLSEVLIAGLLGVEKSLSLELGLPEDEILPCFEGDLFQSLLVGDIPEDAYLAHVITRTGWPMDVARLKAVIRCNFHMEIRGSIDLLVGLASDYELALLSDHAREWIAYIRTIHPFLRLFQHTFFSFELKGTKGEPLTFVRVLDALSMPPGRCLFVDDDPGNVAVATSVGIPSICFVNAEQLAVELCARGLKVDWCQ